MTTIVAADDIFDIRLTGATPVIATSTDIAAWQSLSLPSVVATYQTSGIKTGLFGYDMTDFFSNCETSTSCSALSYTSSYFDGWSVGGYIAVLYSNALQQGQDLGVCFEETYACFGFSLDAAGALDNAWNGVLNASYTFSTTSPTAAEAYGEQVDSDTAAIGYGFLPNWFSAPSIYDASITSKVYWNNFQRIHDYYKFEIADTATAWTVSSVTGDDDDNTTNAVTFASSAALAVPAAIVLSMLTTM